MYLDLDRGEVGEEERARRRGGGKSDRNDGDDWERRGEEGRRGDEQLIDRKLLSKSPFYECALEEYSNA
jgi:hypothetical protein